MHKFLSIYRAKFFFTAVMVCLTAAAFAQLQKFPLPNNGANRGRIARTKIDTIRLTLPFWDDFTISNGRYPDTLKWIQGYSVTINNGMAINQPTTNVATFDGLDSTGTAYNAQQVLETGFNDVLASQPIDLSEDAVSTDQRDSVYLSFFYQWQGTGEAPDNADFLQLEFRKKDSTWVLAATISTTPDLDRTVFYDMVVKLDDQDYFYKDFQFRFRNFGRKSGPYDTWNIDYVYLNKGMTSGGPDVKDLALASKPPSILGTYAAIPYKHFKLKKEFSPLEFDGQNIWTNPRRITDSLISIAFNLKATFTNYYADSSVNSFSKYLEPVDLLTNSVVYRPRERVHYEFDVVATDLIVPDDPQQFDPNAKFVDLNFKLFLQDTAKHGSNPVINDTLSTGWQLRNYYAYDDGTAEFAAGLIEPGSKIAYQFNLYAFDTLKADTLNSIQFYFPSYGVSANQTVAFTVYHDDNGKPGKIWQAYPPRPVGQKGPNIFDELKLIPALLIDEPTFYISWAQPFVGKALIGLDNDNDTGNKIFVSEPGTDWYQNDLVQGSLMLRPAFGRGELDANTPVEAPIQFGMYPNPTDGVFYIDGYYDELRVFTITGNEIGVHAERNGGKTRVTINNSAGLYLVRLRRGAKSSTQKIIISR